MRRPAAIVAVALAVVALIAVVVAVSESSGPEPPATGSAAVVPGDALVYIHVSTDPSRSAVKDALKVGPRFPTYPLLAAQVIGRLSALAGGGSRVDFDRDIRPWLGREAALALLNTTASTAGSELVLDVSRRALARAFVARAGALRAGRYRGTEIYRYRSGSELAFIRHYLVLGQGASVQAAIDAGSGQIPSLSMTGGYQHAAAGEPADRVLDAYFSLDGVRRVLMPQQGLIGGLGTLLDQPGLQGVTLSLSAAGRAAKVRVHAALYPQVAQAGAAHAFAPSLDRLLPAGALLELDAAGLAKVAPRVLDAAAAAGIAGQVGPLLRRLGGALAAEGVNVGRVESLFSGETAVAIGPGSRLTIVTRTPDEQATRTQLASLEVPLSQLFPTPSSGSGQVPQFSNRVVDGIGAHRLSLEPGLELDYAVFHGLLVVSTSIGGIGAVAEHKHSLAADPAYRTVLSRRPGQVTSLLFLDFSQLLNLAERTGLLRGARYQALRPDLERIRAVGLDSTRGEADSTAELTLQIS